MSLGVGGWRHEKKYSLPAAPLAIPSASLPDAPLLHIYWKAHAMQARQLGRHQPTVVVLAQSIMPSPPSVAVDARIATSAHRDDG